eukprot:3486228-Pyramimonas_sp.AAC.1
MEDRIAPLLGLNEATFLDGLCRALAELPHELRQTLQGLHQSLILVIAEHLVRQLPELAC